MIKILYIFLLSNMVIFSQFGGGSGTDTDPYQIWTKSHLTELSDSITSNAISGNLRWSLNKHFRLMADIIDSVRQSIGLNAFLGHFYGGGNKITLAINYDYYTYRNPALFTGLGLSTVNTMATIDSLIVDGYINDGTAAITSYITYGASVTNCINNAVVTNTYGSMGGITYSNGGTISNCINNGDITGVSNIGGICGQNVGGTITNCINTGKITATNSRADEFVVYTTVGGIVGTTVGQATISNCINIGDVIGQGGVGGIFGAAAGVSDPMHTYFSTITGCVNYGYISGTNGVGGILGYMFNSLVNISDCVNEGVIEGEADVGATVGKSK